MRLTSHIRQTFPLTCWALPRRQDKILRSQIGTGPLALSRREMKGDAREAGAGCGFTQHGDGALKEPKEVCCHHESMKFLGSGSSLGIYCDDSECTTILED